MTTNTTAAAVIDGPASAISWAATAAGNILRSALMPVTAGKTYGPILLTTGSITSRTVEWIDAGSAVISTSSAVPGTSPIFGCNQAGLLAPALAVNARIKVTASAAGTITVGCVGMYEGETVGANIITPARWWPIGADAKIWAWVQWPDPLAGMTGSAVNVNWLHVQIDVTAWDDGALHMLAWNGWPGVAGHPVVWADGVRVTTGWTVSYPGINVGFESAHVGTYNGSSMGGGFGTTVTPSRVDTTNPSALSVPVALLGAARYEVTPDDVSIGRAYSFFGGKKTLGTTYASDTGAQMTQTLDQLGWPTALRDIGARKSTMQDAFP